MGDGSHDMAIRNAWVLGRAYEALPEAASLASTIPCTVYSCACQLTAWSKSQDLTPCPSDLYFVRSVPCLHWLWIISELQLFEVHHAFAKIKKLWNEIIVAFLNKQ